MTTYQQLKADHAKELNEFEGFFFAFNESQFADGMKKIGLQPGETTEIRSLGYGGYILKSRSEAFRALFTRSNKEMEESLKDPTFLLGALAYELSNHEYCITWDTSDALEALGLDEKDIPADILKEARRLASQNAA